MQHHVTITRHENGRYSVITDIVLSDGSVQADSDMCLVGALLRSREQKNVLRTGGLLSFTLGPKALDKIVTMDVNTSVVFPFIC